MICSSSAELFARRSQLVLPASGWELDTESNGTTRPRLEPHYLLRKNTAPETATRAVKSNTRMFGTPPGPLQTRGYCDVTVWINTHGVDRLVKPLFELTRCRAVEPLTGDCFFFCSPESSHGARRRRYGVCLKWNPTQPTGAQASILPRVKSLPLTILYSDPGSRSTSTRIAHCHPATAVILFSSVEGSRRLVHCCSVTVGEGSRLKT